MADTASLTIGGKSYDYETLSGSVGPDVVDIRKLYAESIEANSVHGSDSDENAAIEIAFFFSDGEIVG